MLSANRKYVDFFEGSGKYRHMPINYCRNPDGADGPWCYYYDNRPPYDFVGAIWNWQYCFPDCRKFQNVPCGIMFNV